MVFLDPTFIPTDHTQAILSRPASFIPTPSSCPHTAIHRQIQDFIRKLQWSAALPSSNPPEQRLGPISSSRWPPKSLVPSHILLLSGRILGATKSLLSTDHCCHAPNLTPGESAELARLASLSSATIKPSDKGGKWAVVPTSHYRREALRQLTNSSFYEPISSEPTRHIRAKLTQILNLLRDKRFLTGREFRHLLPPVNPQIRNFYLLPKLHKPLWPSSHMPPGRPIVSDVRSVSRKCSDLVNIFLLPLCSQQPSYLKD